MKIAPFVAVLSLCVLTSCVFGPTREYNLRYAEYDTRPIDCAKPELADGITKDIQPVAQQSYREHLWYRVYTRPSQYFHWLRNNCQKITSEKMRKETVSVLAIGDSWFAYPKNFAFFDFLFGGRSNLLTSLDGIENLPKLYTLSLSNSGEVVANMAGIAEEDPIDIVESMQKDVRIPFVIVQSMAEAKRLGLPFDYVMISGGGNDVLAQGRLKELLKHEFCTHTDVLQCIDTGKLEQYVTRVEKAYRTLLHLVIHQPGYEQVKVITHTYDCMIPMPVGADFFGKLISVGEYGWVYPHLTTYGVTPEQGKILVRHILSELKNKLLNIQNDNKERFIVVDTQGTLDTALQANPCLSAWDWGRMRKVRYTPRDLWLNEIHPTSEGFEYLAKKIHKTIAADMNNVQIEKEQDPGCGTR